MIKVIAFDLDDTLWEVDPVIIRAERELAAWLKREVPHIRYDLETLRELRAEIVGRTPNLEGRVTELRRTIIEQALVRSDIAHQPALQLATTAMEVFLDARNRIEMFDGAHDALTLLAKDFVIGALTNGNADLKRLGLSDLFSFAFSAEEVGALKPADDLFRAALSHTGAAPHEMVYVGDHPHHDVDGANRAGLKTIWVDNKIKVREPGETLPDAVVTHVRDVPAAVRRLME